MPGVQLTFVDEREDFAPIATSITHRALYRLLARRPPRLLLFERRLLRAAAESRPDVVLVVKGTYVRPQIVRQLRQMGATLVNFSTDDPFNPSARSPYLQDAIGEYDIYATPRTANVEQLVAAGARKAVVVPFGYKPSVHFVPPDEPDERSGCDLLFIGGADADRFRFFRRIVELWPDVRLDLYGNYWNRDAMLSRFWRGFAHGDVYRRATRRARFAINLVRRANRDGHVMRTFEVPACGGCLLTERTDDHGRFFDEGRDALFFDSPEDLVAQASALTADDARRRVIAAAGHDRVTRERHTYRDRLDLILQAV